MAKKPVKYFVVDAFTGSPLKGNPAAVCLLEEKRDEDWLQAVASEFNISQTCYLTRGSGSESALNSVIGTSIPRFGLRWFTPIAEVKLCGHATLAASHILFTSGLVNSDIIEFATLSGILTVKRVIGIDKTSEAAQDRFYIELDFPADPVIEFTSADISHVSGVLKGASIVDLKKTTNGDHIFVVLPSAKAVTELQPEFDAIAKCPGTGMIVSGPSSPESGFDFYSRVFFPKLGINEDPVCGTAHCALASYYSKKLGKCDLVAYAASRRGGVLNIRVDEQSQRVLLRGKAVTVMEGSLLA
ncbi:Phenazine biosynthesis PhzF protein [Quillaja saponaria]|uniref:Phenazine biosynthesis PhzF protein n=1 Tax=Quillaja saponaria TaxID=32244 RepID=A0AAD7Q0Z2_QUISA|nr:Phenazine biosynthesis PhzF protein [Quillaja saponaria]KAJ7972816.1 Phenazine biosynthesis PhzF protein [Quillaja saponaria]